MPYPFIMPKFDMDQEKATIVSWSKAEGEHVQAEETVLVVETEKVAIDVPCPATGILAGIRYQAGDTVPVTTIIAYILKEGETLADLPGEAPAVRQPLAAASPEPTIPPQHPATPLAARLAQDLTARGYEVWFDRQLQSGRSWAREIQQQLHWLSEEPGGGRFVFLLTRHSTRENSFCLSELQYAIDHQVPVFPVIAIG